MPAFIVANVRILDAERYADYARAVLGLSESFGGRALVRGVVSEWLEGEGDPAERVIVSEFPDADSARAYIGSSQYQAARKLRAGAAEIQMRLIEG